MEKAAVAGTIPDNQNPIFTFSMTDANLLVSMLSDALDTMALMRLELKNRGYNETGEYIGFK